MKINAINVNFPKHNDTFDKSVTKRYNDCTCWRDETDGTVNILVKKVNTIYNKKNKPVDQEVTTSHNIKIEIGTGQMILSRYSSSGKDQPTPLSKQEIQAIFDKFLPSPSSME